MSDRLDAMARRLSGDRFFLASALQDFAHSEGVNGHGLAAALGCPEAALGPLGLCRRPRPDDPSFHQDVERVAQRFGIDPAALLAVLRRAGALEALREMGGEQAGRLAAARDRISDTGDPEAEEDGP